MSILDFNTYLNLISQPRIIVRDIKNSITTVQGRTFSDFTVNPFAGGTPSTTATGSDSGLTGAITANTAPYGMVNSTASLWLPQVNVNMAQSGLVMLIDRLAQIGNMSATGTIQNIYMPMPTANNNNNLFTRYTGSYSGTWCAIEIFGNSIGTTAQSGSGTYVNQNSSTSSFPATNFGGTGFDTQYRFIILPLQPGDTGIQNVLTYCISGAGVGTGTGTYGFTFFRPLMMWVVPNLGSQAFLFDAVTNNGCQLAQIQNNACLQLVFISQTTSTGFYGSVITMIEA